MAKVCSHYLGSAASHCPDGFARSSPARCARSSWRPDHPGQRRRAAFPRYNARTALGYHDNFYFDEFFWTFKFRELNKVASGMAMQKQYRRPYFSMPSSMAHKAYSFWTGERFNKGKPAAKRINIDVSHDALQQGRLCEDKVWRQIVTILDAEAHGCDPFDLEELRQEYDAETCANLLMCQFVDDGASIFPLAALQPCMVDMLDRMGRELQAVRRPALR